MITAPDPRLDMFYSVCVQFSETSIPLRNLQVLHPVKLTIEVHYSLVFLSPSYNCEVNQSKQHVRNHSKTHHGKINKVVLFFAHMANFGNASTCVYLKQKIAQSVLQMRRFVTSFSRTGSQQAHLKLFNS